MSRIIQTLTAVVLGGVLSLPSSVQGQETVFRVPVTGVVELGLAPFIERAIREAEAVGAQAIVLDIDTPGGRVDAAERIADAIADAEVPVYAFVNRRAFSAGALIALATQGIYMRPGSVLGAVTPVDGSGTKASEKIVSAMRSEMRALAEARGLDPAVAEAMVDESLAIPDVVESGKLLTLTTEEAVGLEYARSTDNFTTLLDDLDLTGAAVRDLEVNWAERLVRFFSHPVVAPFLLSLGFLGLIIEIKTPSLGLAGAAGVLSLSLFFGSHLILGLAGWEDLLVFGAGVPFLAAEAMVIQGFGLFGIPDRSGLQQSGGCAQHDLAAHLGHRMGTHPPPAQKHPAVSYGNIPRYPNGQGYRVRVGPDPAGARGSARGGDYGPETLGRRALRRRAHRHRLGVRMDRGGHPGAHRCCGGVPTYRPADVRRRGFRRRGFRRRKECRRRRECR